MATNVGRAVSRTRVSGTLEADGYTVRQEVRIPTPNGAKSSRWVDVAGYKGDDVRYYQSGRQNLNGSPVSREVQALDDIEGATGIRPSFVPYNVGEPMSVPIMPMDGPVEVPIIEP